MLFFRSCWLINFNSRCQCFMVWRFIILGLLFLFFSQSWAKMDENPSSCGGFLSNHSLRMQFFEGSRSLQQFWFELPTLNGTKALLPVAAWVCSPKPWQHGYAVLNPEVSNATFPAVGLSGTQSQLGRFWLSLYTWYQEFSFFL